MKINKKQFPKAKKNKKSNCYHIELEERITKKLNEISKSSASFDIKTYKPSIKTTKKTTPKMRKIQKSKENKCKSDKLTREMFTSNNTELGNNREDMEYDLNMDIALNKHEKNIKKSAPDIIKNNIINRIGSEHNSASPCKQTTNIESNISTSNVLNQSDSNNFSNQIEHTNFFETNLNLNKSKLEKLEKSYNKSSSKQAHHNLNPEINYQNLIVKPGEFNAREKVEQIMKKIDEKERQERLNKEKQSSYSFQHKLGKIIDLKSIGQGMNIIQNSEILLAMFEVVLNPFESLKFASPKSKTFWNEVKNNSLCTNIFYKYKSETFQKYWSRISQLDEDRRFIEVIIQKREQIDKSSLVYLLMFNFIFKSSKLINLYRLSRIINGIIQYLTNKITNLDTYFASELLSLSELNAQRRHTRGKLILVTLLTFTYHSS